MKKDFAVIGLGRFGLALVEKLSELGANVIAIDVDEEAVTKASKFASFAAICDSKNEENLKNCGIQNCSHAIICIGNDMEATLITTVAIKELGVPKITVRLNKEYYSNTIKKLGATEIIYPEKSSGYHLAHKIISDSFVDYYKFNSEYSVVSVHVCENFHPITLIELDPRNTFDINIVLITRGLQTFMPKGTDLINPYDEILIIGKNNNIIKFDKFINREK